MSSKPWGFVVEGVKVVGNKLAISFYKPIKMKLYDDEDNLLFDVEYYGRTDESMFAPQDWAASLFNSIHPSVVITKIDGEILKDSEDYKATRR
jgi:hypothetical protein|tara:strand:- start:39 stop:317 length:279 start_codon:yes stop_codon:yes gene_type:complete